MLVGKQWITVLCAVLLCNQVLADDSYCTSIVEFHETTAQIQEISSAESHSPNVKCFRIAPTVPHDSIELDFTFFSTGPNDYVKVYDGSDSTGTLLHFLSGTFGYVQPVYSSSGSLFITFTSVEVNSVWKANYEAFSLCQGTTLLISPNGTVDDGSRGRDYMNNANCSWILSPSLPGVIFAAIKMNFSYISTQEEVDTITVYNGVDETATVAKVLSGYTQDIVYASGPNALVQFRSDSSTTADGFTMQYTALFCFNSTITDAAGTINDGSDSYPYQTGVTCKWVLNPEGKYRYMELRFLSLAINTASLSFFSGIDETGKMLAYLAPGSQHTEPLYSDRKEPMAILFSTLEDEPDQGFGIEYRAINCYGTVNVAGLEGFIDDGSDDMDYSNSVDCTWVIPVENTVATVTLQFVYFESDPNDVLTITAGNSTTAEILATYSGSMNETVILTGHPGQSLMLHFVTDAQNTAKGWLLHYSIGLPRIPPIDPLGPPTPTELFPVESTTTSQPEQDTSGSTNASSDESGLIAAAVILCVLAAAAVIVLVVLVVRYRKARANQVLPSTGTVDIRVTNAN